MKNMDVIPGYCHVEHVELEQLRERAALCGELAEALRELRCWMVRTGESPWELGAKCETDRDALRQCDAALAKFDGLGGKE